MESSLLFSLLFSEFFFAWDTEMVRFRGLSCLVLGPRFCFFCGEPRGVLGPWFPPPSFRRSSSSPLSRGWPGFLFLSSCRLPSGHRPDVTGRCCSLRSWVPLSLSSCLSVFLPGPAPLFLLSSSLPFFLFFFLFLSSSFFSLLHASKKNSLRLAGAE